MEIDRLTFCLTHVATLRRMFFGHMQIADGVKDKMQNCGMSRNPTENDVDPGMLIVPGINTISPTSNALKTPQACAEHISKMMANVLTQVGVELPELAYKRDGAEA